MSEASSNWVAIDVYTREQAIKDGVLIDVTETAKEAGWKFPVAVTCAVSSMINPSKEVSDKFGCDRQGRLWDVLWMGMVAAKRGKGGSELRYELILPTEPHHPFDHPVKLKAVCGPGDNAEPVVTIMLPEED